METAEPTWQPYERHGDLTTRSDLPDTVSAFPEQRKEPLTDAAHVRTAVARFDQVIDVSDADRAAAFANIEKAARYYDVDLSETNWHQLGVHPHARRLQPGLPQSVLAWVDDQVLGVLHEPDSVAGLAASFWTACS